MGVKIYFCDIGEYMSYNEEPHWYDDMAYLTREAAQRRADQLREDNRDNYFYSAEVVEVELVDDLPPARTAKAIVVSNGATGYCRCEACRKWIDPWDRYCKHCGAKLEVER